MAKENSEPEVELPPHGGDATAEPDLMTRDEALAAAQRSFLAAEQSAHAAVVVHEGRNAPQHDLAYAIEALAYGLKLLTAVERGNVAET